MILVGLEDFSVNLQDKHELHCMTCEIICREPTNRGSVSTGRGNRLFLQNPLSPRRDDCHTDRVLPRNALAVPALQMAFQAFLPKMVRVISLVNGGFLLTNIECLLSARPLGRARRKGK